MFEQSQNFSSNDRKILGQQKFLAHRKPITFAGQSFPNSEKILRFEVKILFRDHNFFGIKIEKYKTDST